MPGMNKINESDKAEDTSYITIKEKESEIPHWFVLRDLKRSNAKLPAYKMLADMGIEIFTPMVWKLVLLHGKRTRISVPFMQNLLFAHDSRKNLDPIIAKTATLQYRFLRDGNRSPMTVRDADMERFMQAVEGTDNPRYYMPNEVTPNMIGRKVRIIGGPLNGYEGFLQKLQGSRVKRMFVELPNHITAAVEVEPEFIQFVK